MILIYFTVIHGMLYSECYKASPPNSAKTSRQWIFRVEFDARYEIQYSDLCTVLLYICISYDIVLNILCSSLQFGLLYIVTRFDSQENSSISNKLVKEIQQLYIDRWSEGTIKGL